MLALTMLLLILGIGPLSRLGPLFLRPHEAAWWLPMPGDRGTLLVPVARVEYLIAATAGAVMGVLPVLASAGGWGAAVAWPVLIAAGTCLVLSELITAQVQGRGVTRLRRLLILLGAAACLAGTTLTFPRSMTGNIVVATGYWSPLGLCAGGRHDSSWDTCATMGFLPSSPDPSVPTSHCCLWIPEPWGGCCHRRCLGRQPLHHCDWPRSGAGCLGLSEC